jgi:hypothetical protein
MELPNLPNLSWDALSDNPFLKNAFQNHETIIGDDAGLHLDVFVDECLDDPSRQNSFGKQGKNPHSLVSSRLFTSTVCVASWCCVISRYCVLRLLLFLRRYGSFSRGMRVAFGSDFKSRFARSTIRIHHHTVDDRSILTSLSRLCRMLFVMMKKVCDKQWQHQVFKTCTLLSVVEPWTRLYPL